MRVFNRCCPPLALLLSLLLLGSGASLAQERPPVRPLTPAERVAADVAAIVSRIDRQRGAEVAYSGARSALNFIRGHALICTISCEDLPGWGGAFFIYSEVDGRATGELMIEAGPNGTRVLRDEALAEYLERVEFDPAPLRGVYERWYRPRAAQPAPQPQPPPDPAPGGGG